MWSLFALGLLYWYSPVTPLECKASTCFPLLRRETGLLLCKRIPGVEEPLCLACLYCATTMQGLELDLRLCDGKLVCFFCWPAAPCLPLDPFPAVSGGDPPKRGPPPHQLRPLPFSRCWTPFPAGILLQRSNPVSLRKRGKQVEALHSSGVTGLYQYNKPRAKRDHIGTVHKKEETETETQRGRKESLMTRGGVDPPVFSWVLIRYRLS